MQAIEVYALVGAVTHGMLALLYLVVWRRQRSAWSAYLALAYGLIAAIYLFDAHWQPIGPRPNPYAMLLSVPAILLTLLGFMRCGNAPQPWMRRNEWAAVARGPLLALAAQLDLMLAADELTRRQKADAALQSLNETLERRAAQRTTELNDMIAGLESFNRSVSHDLRRPLGGCTASAMQGMAWA